ncbi:HAD family hydrolase [Agromyces sp. SYSU T00194]|uniref:HAD family hydrolase n=1 Tax=Agromyces chitinivorans TaxID=3158560 RepID=UPI0033921F0F
MLVATDLDGTLVPNGSDDVPAFTARVLGRLDAAGIPVVFVTGRPLRRMEAFWPHVGAHGFAVVSNGAVTFDVPRRRIETLAGLEPEAGLAVADAIAAAVPGAHFAVECDDGIRLDPSYRQTYQASATVPRGPLPEVWDRTAVKLLVRHPEVPSDELRRRVVTAVGDRATVTWSVAGLIEVSAPGVTKARALEALCARLGVPAADVVAFGDMPNDLPMLAWAGTAYAVEDAHESVLARADRVAPPCEREGVARVLDGLLGSA